MSGPVELFYEGDLGALSPAQRDVLLERSSQTDSRIRRGVADIVADVGARGDEAIREVAARIDAIELGELEVPAAALREALASQPAELVAALESAREAISSFHATPQPPAWETETRPGVRVGWRPEPLQRVAAYAPGGRAVYPSSVLMSVIPAKAARVDEILVCSPPQADGLPSPVVLAACAIAGADRVFSVGGAAAIAAVAYGTESVPQADKVVGPGNAYVTEAKRQLSGVIGIDCLAGPSELLVIADADADAELIALELMAQAEHDPEAVVVAAATTATMARRIREALDRLIHEQPRAPVVRQALSLRGAVLQIDDLEAGLDFAARFAPEHLLLLVRNPRRALDRVRAAGAVFLGPHSSVVFGDYTSGTNHVLPTGGRARSQSGLSTADFMRWSSYQQLDPEGAAGLADLTATLAEAEGLGGHAMAARARAKEPAAVGGGAGAAANGGAATAAETGPRPRPEYAALDIYDPGRRPCPIDLSDNTNLFGTPPAAVRAVADLDRTAMSRYPSVYADSLKEAYADYAGVAASCVTSGCGSDDLIDSTIRAFCEPGSTLAFPEPTFSMVGEFARMNGVTPSGVSLDPGFELCSTSLLAAKPRAIYLCRPNNPTGNSFPRDAVQELAEQFDGLILVDEAYAEFADDSLAAWAPETRNVVVLRTLSKAFGLAGLRVGFAIGPEVLVAAIEKSRGPYKVGVVAETASTAALLEDRDWLAHTVSETRVNRDRLARALADLGYRSWPSTSNFLLVAAPADDAGGFAATLAAAGVGVRPFAQLPQAGDCVRVTVGPWSLMEPFLEVCKELT